MEFISAYDSDSEENGDYEESSIQENLELNVKAVRKVYLVTYSQADLDKFPTRLSFARAVLCSFVETPATVAHWSCSREEHRESGSHYHMALKLDRNQRWMSSKRFLEKKHNISVHFSSVHHNYFSAWKYVTKYDEGVLLSEAHPDLWNSRAPKTTKASMANKPGRKRSVRKCSSTDGDREDESSDFEFAAGSQGNCDPSKRKKRRLSAFDLSEIVVEKGIKTRTELLALAYEQKVQGKSDIAEFVVNRGPKVVAEVISTAWEMQSAKETLIRSKKSRIELLQEAKESDCVPGCNGLWLQCAKDVLQRNGVVESCFSTSVKELLEKGRGKYRNIMIVGPANCGKTFLLNPLNVIYKTFCNPASTSFAWVGAEQAECIFLNDFRWSQQIIQWHDFLLMLEGQTVHLPAPKTHYSKDMVIDSDTPIFCTGKHSIIYIKNVVVDERETEMMSVRWKVFNFNAQIPEEEQRQVPSCPSCFAKLIFGDGDDCPQ